MTVSCDLNYRANLWSYGKSPAEVMPELVNGCDIILGNEEDAEKHFGISPDSSRGGQGSYESVCRQLAKKFPASSKVIITLRDSINASHNKWSGVLLSGDEFIVGTDYDITHIVDRVGAGDAFMAGIIYGLTQLSSDKQALEFAIAASCLKHTIPGDFNRVNVDEFGQWR